MIRRLHTPVSGRRSGRLAWVLGAALLALSCRPGSPTSATPGGPADPAAEAALGQTRPGDEGSGTPGADPAAPPDGPPPYLLLPPADAQGPHPLVLLLHPYGGIAQRMLAFHEVRQPAADNGWIVAAPTGAFDERGMPFWNATDACCDRDGTASDDLGRLRRLIEYLVATYDVDTTRVVAVGQSNGAFMAYRLACDASDQVTGVVAIAGVEWADRARCAPEHPVSVLHIHARDDDVIEFYGEEVSPLDDLAGHGYPGAEDTVERWAERNGCGESTTTTASTAGPGELKIWAACERGTFVHLHALETGGHRLLPEPDIARLTTEFVQRAARRP